ncbi:hypothetical protein CTI12_AA299450 [Artemisia annua]|uniref:KIB1-4 beta-propeller domain-containing protein n=1 Tax=Artemisia annua TaxID=35608 RepID=A0A2U1N740_ARTAN|nr:hypothetical protein CTI12_AA299450 [Artemisia annua]
MSYGKQLKRLSFDGELLHNLTCCNDKVYALSTDGSFTNLVIQVDIRVGQKEVVIILMLFGACPLPSYSSYRCSGGDLKFYLKGSCAELFYIIYYENKSLKTSADVCLFKLDVTSIKWDELEGLKDWDISDLRFDDWVYDDYPDFHKSHQIWEEIDDLKDANLFLDLSRDQSVSYSRSPVIKWSNKTLLRGLRKYSVASPWLMAVDKNRDVITFKDPMLGDNYLMKNSPISIASDNIFSSRFGWLLLKSNDLMCLVLYNPFTNDLRKLPQSEYIYDMESLNFSAPPTSPDCIVVGFTTWDVHIHFVNRKPKWRIFSLGPDPHTIWFSSFYGRNLYALCKEGEVIVFNNLGRRGCSWKTVEAEAPESACGSLTQKFLTICEQHLILVCVSEFGEHVEVFKLNEVKQEWEKITGVGKHMIYICDTTCLCLEAKTPQMENKIFFPRVSCENRKIVFYSLDTCMYHTFDGENIQQPDLFGTKYYLSGHTWIEPSW